MVDLKEEIDVKLTMARQLKQQQDFLQMSDIKTFPQQAYFDAWLTPLYHMWELILDWRDHKDAWLYTKFDKLDLEEIQDYLH